MIDFAKIFYFIFGAFTIIGGVIGYVKAGSVASIVAGAVSGALLIVAGVMIANANVRAGLIIGGIVSLLLAIRFLPLFLQKHTVMPEGMVTLFSVISLILTVLAFIKKP